MVSGTKGKQKETTLDDALGVDALKEHLATLKKAKGSEALVVSVVGLPNVSKHYLHSADRRSNLAT